MNQQNVLNDTDIDRLINLLLRSQQSRTREALCLNIGIDPQKLSFLRDSSDSDFFLLLIKYLSEIDNKEAICKLCCKELVPVFNKGTYGLFLNELAVKLNCNEKSIECSLNSSNQSNTSKPQSSLKKNSPLKYLLTAGVLLLSVLTASSFYGRSSSQTLEVHADTSKGTAWINKENAYVKVNFKAQGTWLAIPENEPNIQDDAKGYLSPNGNPNFNSNTTPCRAPLGALVIRGEDGKCKEAYGEQGSFELKPRETVYFLMNDVLARYGDNKGTINVKLSVSRR